AVGGFLPVRLHDSSHDPLPEADAFIDACLAAGANLMVLAAITGVDGYDARPVLDDTGWTTMLTNLDRIHDLASSRDVAACLHPHVGTMVERGDEVERVMDGSSVGLCVDTGHLAVGGADPVAITAAYSDRVTHVHLKDVDMAMARQVVAGELAFGAAVKSGMFRPLGQGDVDIATLITTLEGVGYSGWYVLEQDVMLDDVPDGAGPAENVRKSLDYLLGSVG
ncbi:MAG: TIM barrel protein, partial [Nocardioidaceae bacterium]